LYGSFEENVRILEISREHGYGALYLREILTRYPVELWRDVNPLSEDTVIHGE
jgi:hypothetical protein